MELGVSCIVCSECRVHLVPVLITAPSAVSASFSPLYFFLCSGLKPISSTFLHVLLGRVFFIMITTPIALLSSLKLFSLSNLARVGTALGWAETLCRAFIKQNAWHPRWEGFKFYFFHCFFWSDGFQERVPGYCMPQCPHPGADACCSSLLFTSSTSEGAHLKVVVANPICWKHFVVGFSPLCSAFPSGRLSGHSLPWLAGSEGSTSHPAQSRARWVSCP